MKLWLKISLVVFSVLLLTFVYFAVRAYRDLVTLDVRDMDVREVVKKIEWQTWESIYVQKEVEGKVTLNVHDAPLESVLAIIGEQTSSRWTALYPLYSSRSSLKLLKAELDGQEVTTGSWTNLHHRGFFGGGIFSMTARDQNQLVTLNFVNKELEVAAMAVSRFGQAQVVPENGASQTVSVLISNAPMVEAVELLAKKADKSWTKLYELQSWRGGRRGPPREGSLSESNTNNPGTNGDQFAFFNRSPEDEEARRKRMEAQLATMTPDERKQFEDRRKEFEAMRNMSPEERRKKFGEMAQRPEFQARMQQRMMNAIENLTPEQRVERIQRFQQFRNRGGR